MIFSLIIATYGRSAELDSLLLSLTNQEIKASEFEVIIVDQNDLIDLSNIIEKHESKLQLTHIKSDTKGLSYNRNLGLKIARGQYVCFPDDDCTYYPDTLKTVLRHFEESGADSVFGAIRDRTKNENIIRNWPRLDKTLNRLNFFSLYSSITIFTRRRDIYFNESLGAGCYFGSYEDADYAYRLVASTTDKCIYFGDIEVWHPKIGVAHFTASKNVSYSLGFGGFCYIHKSDYIIIAIFCLSLCYHLARSILSLITLNRLSSSRHCDSFFYRLKGFTQYKTLS